MVPYLLILLSVSTSLVEGTVIKHYNRKYSNGGFIFTAFVSLFSMLFFLFTYIIADGEKGDFTPLIIPYGIAAGIAYCTASLLTYIALQTGPFSISMLVLSFGTVVSSVFGIIFLGERATASTFVGIALVIFALILLGNKSKDEKKQVSAKWLISITLSVFLASGYSLLTRLQLMRFGGTVNNEFKIIALGFSAIVLFTVGFLSAKRGAFGIIRSGFPYAAIAGISNGITNFIGLFVAAMMDLSISSPTSMITKNVLTFLIALLIFKEKMSYRKISGLIVGMIAVLLITLRI